MILSEESKDFFSLTNYGTNYSDSKNLLTVRFILISEWLKVKKGTS